MEKYREEFIEFMMNAGVLTFGDFVTKSGRKTPFFINTGNYRTGRQLKSLGSFYAKAIVDAYGKDFDVLFGPAYKGIPLSVCAAIALSEEYDTDVRYCSNRKEIKDHGDTGILLGGPVNDGDRVVIIEDVTTAGTSIRETVPILKAQADVEIAGLIISVDRMEKGRGERSALAEISEEFGIKTSAIVTMADVKEYLSQKGGYDDMIASIDEYYKKYGANGGIK